MRNTGDLYSKKTQRFEDNRFWAWIFSKTISRLLYLKTLIGPYPWRHMFVLTTRLCVLLQWSTQLPLQTEPGKWNYLFSILRKHFKSCVLKISAYFLALVTKIKFLIKPSFYYLDFYFAKKKKWFNNLLEEVDSLSVLVFVKILYLDLSLKITYIKHTF